MNPRDTFYRERDAIFQALARGENPYGGLQNAINSIYNTYGRDSGVSYQEVAGIIGEAFNAAAPQQTTTRAGGGSARAATAPTVTADLSGKINALNDMYNVIYQDLGNLAKEKRGNIEKSLGTQRSNLQSQFQDVATQLPGQYNAQGIGQSSYYAKAAGKAQDVYNQNVEAIKQEQDQKLADLGQWYQSTMGQYQGQQAAVGATPRSVTGTAADVQGVQSGLDTRLNELGQARTGLQSQGQNIAGLASIAPTQNTGADQLKKMLGELATSSIPDFAKQTIAKGKIQQSGQDQAFYTDYFDKLKQPTPGA
jgi:hypothetical protein